MPVSKRTADRRNTTALRIAASRPSAHDTALRRFIGGVDAAPETGSPLWIPPLLTAIARGTSLVDAATIVGVDPRIVYNRRHIDPVFRRAYHEAVYVSTQLLEAELTRRAVHGVAKPVYQRGHQVGTIQEYSDQLLMFLLRARAPGRYDRDRGVTGTGGPITLNVTVVDVGNAPKPVDISPAQVDS